MAEALKGFAPVAKQRSFVSDQDIISRLDVIAEYRNLGVRFVTTTPNEDGWVDCHGMGRDDENASAGVHVASGYFNDFGDPNNAETRHSLFDMAWMYGPFNDFSEAKRHFSEKVGIQLRGKRDPDKNLVIHDNSEEDDRVWRCTICLRKPGITVQALRHAGAKPGVYRGNFPVVALPVVGTTLDIEHPIGRVMLPIGNDLPVLNKDGSVKSREKMKTTGGSDGGLVIAPSDIEVLKDPEKRKNIEAVWKVEGITDLLAFHAQLPANLVGKVIPFTNSDGCKANPVEAHLEHFNDLTVYVVGDADDPGEIGAKKWASKLATHARKTTHVRIAEDVTRKHGKDLRDCFTKEGWTYYDLVDQAEKFDPVDKRPKPFSNYREFGEGEIEPILLVDIATQLNMRISNRIKRVGCSLFVDEADGSESVRWLENTNQLFAWIRKELDPVEWKDRKDGLVKRTELLEHLRESVESYDQIEHIPHEPPVERTYYTCDHSPLESEGENYPFLIQLVKRFEPAEPGFDSSLILSMFTTLFWGGDKGTRPAFVITSDDGPGSGKTTLSQIAGMLAGGYFDFTQSDKAEDIRKQLLSSAGLGKRLARIDNIKSSRFSWGALESLITADYIEGWRLFQGNARRPNRLTWILTVNGVNLSKDMAERSVIIKLAKPKKYSASWAADTVALVKNHRREIVCEILKLLSSEETHYEGYSATRWPSWEEGVLGRCIGSNKAKFKVIQDVLKARMGEVDADQNESEMFEEYVERKLNYIGFTQSDYKVHIPNEIIAKWWKSCFSDGKRNTEIYRNLHQMTSQKKVQQGLYGNPSRTYGRGFIFQKGEHEEANYQWFHNFNDPEINF